MPELVSASQGTFDIRAGLKSHYGWTCRKFTPISFFRKNKLTSMANIDIIANARGTLKPTERILIAGEMTRG
jgi:hypothetical protein